MTPAPAWLAHSRRLSALANRTHRRRRFWRAVRAQVVWLGGRA